MSKLSPKEKIAIQRENIGIKKQLSSGDIKAREKLKLQKQWKENLKRLGAKPKQKQPEASDMLTRYLAGEFSGMEITDFIGVIDVIEGEGASLDQIKVGAKGWAEAHAEKLAA